MKTHHYIALGVCLAILISTATTRPPTSRAAEEATTLVSVEDVGTKVTLIGRLGQPLAKAMDVKGTWQRKPYLGTKDDSARFTVTHVNGKALKNPVAFHRALVKAVYRGRKPAIPPSKEREKLDGVSWTLRAYETGRFDRQPENWWEEEGYGPVGRPVWLETFTSELVGVVQEGK